MNLKSYKGKLGSRSGVTLVELLVVILIVTILAVALLPVFRKFVIEAQYAAEALPLVGHVRTQIGLYQYEHNQLPGTEFFLHTYKTVGTAGNASAYKAMAAAETTDAGLSLPSFATPAGYTVKTEVFLAALDLKADEFIGNKMKPTHFQYLNLGTKGSSYAYAVGVFGDGNGLPQATGYAVFEANIAGIDNSAIGGDPGAKVVGIWKNYSGTGVTAKQIMLAPQNTPAAQQVNHCIVHQDLLGITALGALNTQLDTMKDTGWKFTN